MSRRTGLVLDLVGLGLAVAAAGWALLVGRATDSDPWWFVAGVGGVVAAFVVARLVARVDPWLPASGVAAGVVGAMVLTVASLSSSGGGPLGYANSNAALAVVGLGAAAAAASPVAKRSPGSFVHPLAGSAVVVLVVAIVATRSAAAMLLVAAGAVAALVCRRAARMRAVLPGVVVATLLAVQVTTALGLAHDEDDRRATRLALWREATVLIADEPGRGVGIGQFAEESAVARTDADLRWAHHEYLQQGAEQGLPGFVLLLLAVLWAAARLAVTRPFGDRTMVAGLVLGAVAVHASVDHVLHDWPVPVALAVLLGAATAGVRPPRRPAPGTPGSPLPQP